VKRQLAGPRQKASNALSVAVLRREMSKDSTLGMELVWAVSRKREFHVIVRKVDFVCVQYSCQGCCPWSLVLCCP